MKDEQWVPSGASRIVASNDEKRVFTGLGDDTQGLGPSLRCDSESLSLRSEGRGFAFY